MVRQTKRVVHSLLSLFKIVTGDWISIFVWLYNTEIGILYITLQNNKLAQVQDWKGALFGVYRHCKMFFMPHRVDHCCIKIQVIVEQVCSDSP